MRLLNPSAYGLRHGKKVPLSKLGRSCSQPIPFHMAKTLYITQYWENQRKIVRLTDESIVTMMDMGNITHPSKGTLGGNRQE